MNLKRQKRSSTARRAAQIHGEKKFTSERVGCYAYGVVYAMLPSCYAPRVAGDESEVNARSSEDTVAIFATSSTHSANRRRARRSDGGGIAPNHASGERGGKTRRSLASTTPKLDTSSYE